MAKFLLIFIISKSALLLFFCRVFPLGVGSLWVLCGFYDPSTVLRRSFDEIRKNSSSFHRVDHTFYKGNLVLR